MVGNFENERVSVSKFNLKTGDKTQDSPFESITTKPRFLNNILYGTVRADGGKMLAYQPDESKIIWQQDIGHGVVVQPVFLEDKIIANVEDDYWVELGYNEKLLNTKSKIHTYLDTEKIAVKKYKFLTHDDQAINDFLNKSKVSHSEYQTRTSATHTVILTENKRLVLGDHKKKVAQLDLETAFPTILFMIPTVPFLKFYPKAFGSLIRTI